MPTWIETVPAADRRSRAGCRSSRSSSRSATAPSSPAARFLHPDRRADRRPGRPRPDHRRGVSFAFAVPLGRLADQVGPKRIWALVALAQALLFLVWPWLDGFAPVRRDGGRARDRRHGRRRGLRRLHAQRVLARGAGALAGLHAQRAQHRLHPRRPHRRPRARDQQRHGHPAGADPDGRASSASTPCSSCGCPDADARARRTDEPAPRTTASGPSVLRNRGFLAMSFFDGILGTNQVLLNVVIPLWLVQETDAPRVLLAWLFGTNTVLAVLLQVPASRGVRDRRWRAARRPDQHRLHRAVVLRSCMVTHDTLGWVTIAAGLARPRDRDRRRAVPVGRPLGPHRPSCPSPTDAPSTRASATLGGTLGSVWAPALFTFLAMSWGTTGLAGRSPAIVRRRRHRHPPGRPGRRALPGAPEHAGRRPTSLLESPVMTTPAQWLAGARPRTLPAAVSPVLAGTGVAAYGDEAVWWKAALALVVSLALQVGVNYANDYSDGVRGTDADRVGPMRLVGSGAAPPGAVKTAAFVAFGVAGVAGLVLAASTAWWLVARRRRVGRGRLVLHRRLEALRLPRPRRGDGLRVLRAGRRARHGLRPDRGAHPARPVRRLRHRRARLRDPRRQQPARHPHRPGGRQDHAGRPARGPGHAQALHDPDRRRTGAGGPGRDRHHLVGAARAGLRAAGRPRRRHRALAPRARRWCPPCSRPAWPSSATASASSSGCWWVRRRLVACSGSC